MRKKDYKLIAEGLQAFMMASWRHDDPQYEKLCSMMAMALSSEAKFDRQEFLAACGIRTLEQDIKEVAELEAKLDSDPDWRAQSATDNRECWTCHKAVSVCGHSQPV